MARGVDEVQLVCVPVVGGVHHADGVGLDGDAALALEVHGVEHLGLHLAHGERSGQLQQAVCQRGFTVVDVRDDRKVAKESGVHSSVASGQLSGASQKPNRSWRPNCQCCCVAATKLSF